MCLSVNFRLVRNPGVSSPILRRATFRLLATSEHCPVAMFRTGERMLGIQGHPEFTAEYVEALVRGRTELIGTKNVLKADFKTKPDEAVITSWMVNFLSR